MHNMRSELFSFCMQFYHKYHYLHFSGMDETFGSTCHGAGRAQSRNASRRTLEYQEVLFFIIDFHVLVSSLSSESRQLQLRN